MIVLTGATGFLGSRLLSKLLLSRKVCIVVRDASKFDRIKNYLNHDNLRVYNLDRNSLDDIFKENQVQVVIHTATEYGRNSESISEVLNSNLILPIRLIEHAVKYNVPLFINTDSYFNKNDSYYSSLFNYSLSKKSLLIWLKHLSNKIKVINARLEHIYGPGDNKNKFVEKLIMNVAIERISEIKLSQGYQKRDFIYIDDVVDAYVRLIDYGLSNEFTYKTFEIGSGKSIQIRKFANKVKCISQSPTLLNFGAIEYREDEIMDSKANVDDLHQLGWKSTVNVDQGLLKIIEIYSNSIVS